MQGDHDLVGLTVVSTRPTGQEGGLVHLLRSHGAAVLSFPTIVIVRVAPQEVLADARSEARRSDLVVFVSANAVDSLLENAGDPGFLAAPCIAAIGMATARRLAQYGVAVDLMPEGRSAQGYTTESLLRHPALGANALRGRRALIVRGQGGRELLADELRHRGALVRYAELYRRDCPRPSAEDRRRVLEAREPTVVVATSAEGLGNFWRLLLGGESGRSEESGVRRWLETRRYVVVSDRIANALSRLGAVHPAIVTERASDLAICDAIVRHARSGSWRGS